MGDKYMEAFFREQERIREEERARFKALLASNNDDQLKALDLAALLAPANSNQDYKDALAELLVERATMPKSNPAASDQPVYICLACGEESDSIERCNQCGSSLVSLVSVLEQCYGLDWRIKRHWLLTNHSRYVRIEE